MKRIKKYLRKKKTFSIFSIVLVGILILYYLPFANRGIVFSDEGVYTYTAELIAQGKIPYVHFFLEYPPLYFYILGFLYKLFGTQILVGRLLSLFFCVMIFIASLKLIKKCNLQSKKDKIVAFLCTASFGYPLINIPILTWPSVLITILLMILLLISMTKLQKKYILIIGLLLAVQLALKQNLALTETILVNILLLVSLKIHFWQKIKMLLYMNLLWIVITAVWGYFLFDANNFFALKEFLAFSSRLSTIYAFSYPPLSMILQPLGIIKLLPYYLPLLFVVAIIISFLKKPKDKKILILLLPLNGFFTTIYPVSEMLHVIPYFGLVLLSLYIYSQIYLLRFQIIVYTLILVYILSGFYMIHFMGQYRYHAPYRLQTEPLNLPKSKYLLVEKIDGKDITNVYTFLQTHTKKSEYIFAYNFSPMQYFLFDRPNPSYYPIYSDGYLTIEDEKMTVMQIKNKTKYIITDGNFSPHRPLSEWILQQKKITSYGQFSIFLVQH